MSKDRQSALPLLSAYVNQVDNQLRHPLHWHLHEAGLQGKIWNELQMVPFAWQACLVKRLTI